MPIFVYKMFIYTAQNWLFKLFKNQLNKIYKMKKIEIKKKNEEKKNIADKTKEVKKEADKKPTENKEKKRKDEEETFIEPGMLKDSGAVLLIIIGAFILYSITNPTNSGNVGLIIGNFLNETSGIASILYPIIIILIGCHIYKNFPKKVLYFYPAITVGLIFTIEILRCLLLEDITFLGSPCIIGNFFSNIIESAIGKLGAIVVLLFLALTFLLLFTGKTFKDLGKFIKEKYKLFLSFLKNTKEKLSVKLTEMKEKREEKKRQKEMEKAQKAEEKKKQEELKKQKEETEHLQKQENIIKYPKQEEIKNQIIEKENKYPEKQVVRASDYFKKNLNILKNQYQTEESSIKTLSNTNKQNTVLNRKNNYQDDYVKQQEARNKFLEQVKYNRNNENLDDFLNRKDKIQTSYTKSLQNNEFNSSVKNTAIRNDDYVNDYFNANENKNKTLEELYTSTNNEIKTTFSIKPEKKANVVFGTGSALGRTIMHLREDGDNKTFIQNKNDEVEAPKIIQNSVKEVIEIDPSIEKRQNFLEKKDDLEPALEKRMKFLQDDNVIDDSKETEDTSEQEATTTKKDFLLYRNERFFPKNESSSENTEENYLVQNYDESSEEIIDENYDETFPDESLPDLDTIFEEDEEDNNEINTNQRITNYNNLLKNSIAKAQEEKLNPPLVYEEPIEYFKPSLDILKDKPPIDLSEAFVDRSDELIEKLENFGVTAEVSDILRGPSVTRYELVLGDNIKVSKFTSLQPDLSVFFASKIRIEAPVPGKSCVGIEVPNKKIDPVYLKEIIGSEAFENRKLKIPIALGKDIAGDPVVGDLTKMPHLLVAGSTGSGKSVCMNCLITSILYNFSPNEVQMVMIDPKRVELSMYEGIPHLIDIKATPDYNIITDPKIAALVLNQMTETMDRRYDEFNRFKAKNIFEFNAKSPVKYPYLIIFIDELADLMMVSGGNIETPICRIAQMGRAAGIHLVIATQRPTVNVITGTIKVNVPSRIAFAVTSSIDSRTILDKQGAEELLGKGDMLYQPIEANEPKRVQGAYISTEEIEELVAFWQEQPPPNNMMPIDIEPPTQEKEEEKDSSKDALYDEALNIIMAEKYASVSILQRKLKIGYARAGRIIDQMERNGVVGPAEGSKPRKILIGPNAGS